MFLKDHLQKKVSRERIGIEVNKMISGPGNVIQAMQFICDLKYFNLFDF